MPIATFCVPLKFSFDFLCDVFLPAFLTAFFVCRSLFTDLPVLVCPHIDWDRCALEMPMVNRAIFLPIV